MSHQPGKGNGSKLPLVSARKAEPPSGARQAISAAAAEGTGGTQALGSIAACRRAAR